MVHSEITSMHCKFSDSLISAYNFEVVNVISQKLNLVKVCQESYLLVLSIFKRAYLLACVMCCYCSL